MLSRYDTWRLMQREDLYNYLLRCRNIMVEQLQEDVIDYMYHNEFLTAKEYNDIMLYESREDKIGTLLDRLPSMSKTTIAEFMVYLNTWYYWFGEHFKDSYQDSAESMREIKEALQEGQVPPLPLQHVPREECASLCNHLHSIEKGQFVVVYGMGGCGKSTLVTEVLYKSQLVLDKFRKKVFWITVGRDSSVSHLTILQELYARMYPARGYNVPTLPLDIPSAQKSIRERLKNEEYEDCLWILDDVNKRELIEDFNIGCRILVTTDNKNIMNGIRTDVKYIELREGFSEKQSIELFNKNLANVDSKKPLPKQALTIHSLCKGFPLTISLISSQLSEYKEEVFESDGRWDECVSQLQNKDLRAAIGRYDEYRQDQITALYQALQTSIQSLENKKQYYQDFALFMDDVNITPEVLMTLWGLSKKDVLDIMTTFEKKCLAIRMWNVHIKSYVYCVHDLLLDYLKRELTTSERQDLHRKFIAKYQQRYGEDVLNFPKNDSYIFLYLGYHLKEACYFDYFPKLYLNLKFIEAKILEHGTADVLLDFRKYKQYIANSEENSRRYEEFYYFITKIGVLRTNSSSDIVQFGLGEPKNSYIYELSKQLIKNSDKTYFEYITEIPEENSSPVLHHCREKITKAIFDSFGNVIVANSDGYIKLIDLKSNRSIIKFRGHRDTITQLQLSKFLVYFLSASKDATVRIWYLNNISDDFSGKPRTPSPQLVQPNWKDAWENTRHPGEMEKILLNKHSLAITDARFSNKGMMVVSSSLDRKVIVWKFVLEKNKLENLSIQSCGHTVISTDKVVQSCSFTKEDDLVVCATSSGEIFMHNTVNGESMYKISTAYNIKFISVLPEISTIKVLVLAENCFLIIEIFINSRTHRIVRNNEINAREGRRPHNCICAAVSNDGNYFAAGFSNYNIVVRELRTGKEVAKFHETNGCIRGLGWSLDNSKLLTAYENPILKIWNVKHTSTNDRVVKLRHTIFDAAWIPFLDNDSKDDENDGLLVTASLDNKNDIHVYLDYRLNKIISQNLSEDEPICQICVCAGDGSIVYASAAGSVYLIVLDKWTVFPILSVKCGTFKKMRLFYHQNVTVVVLLVEIEQDRYTLTSWIKNETDNDVIGGYQMVYEENSEFSIVDFSVNFDNKSLYVIRSNHQCVIYDYENADLLDIRLLEDSEEQISIVKSVDFSENFRFIACISDKIILSNLNTCERYEYIEKPTVCKFSFDGKYLAVGFDSGAIRVFHTENQFVIEKRDTCRHIIDLMWSPRDYRLILLLDREVALYNIEISDIKLISVLYMSVDKIVCNHSFNKIITVDSSGHFHVLKHEM